ncbi:10243_t:CDS:1, partial [Gigaspora rosea]
NEKLELENYALLNEIEDMKEVYIIQQETINDQETKIEDLDVEVKNLQ